MMFFFSLEVVLLILRVQFTLCFWWKMSFSFFSLDLLHGLSVCVRVEIIFLASRKQAVTGLRPHGSDTCRVIFL